jgi:tetratricopeptide (TPR) repeat protein
MTLDGEFYFVIRIAISQEPIRVTSGHFRQIGICLAVWALLSMVALVDARAQGQKSASAAEKFGSVQGHVRDASGRPVENATVSLHVPGPSIATTGIPWLPTQITHTDSQGAYQFSTVEEGDYVVLGGMADKPPLGHRVHITRNATETIDLDLPAKLTDEAKNAAPVKPAPEKPVASGPEFFDEPQFTVAGVTQASTSGGHGSDTVLRTTEALAKATVSLSKESGGGSNPPASAMTESSLRDAVARNPQDPALHHLLGDVEEKLGNPLEAVREYQRAAELDPSEPNLFDWGTELLTHRALQPATEVFSKGNRLFPESVRMLIALGVAWYARGSYDQAAQCLANASDLAPDNPTPYLFLGKLQSAEGNPSAESLERLRRFAELQPDNALANYYYAVSLWKQSANAVDTGRENDRDKERSARVESLLRKAVHLDPKLGAAYLQLGILYSQHKDFSRAISAYQRAIEVIPEQATLESDETLEVAHYRLGQAYVRTGDKGRAQEQLQLHDRLAKKTKEHTERERREIQQFVISLRNKDSVSQPQN